MAVRHLGLQVVVMCEVVMCEVIRDESRGDVGGVSCKKLVCGLCVKAGMVACWNGVIVHTSNL